MSRRSILICLAAVVVLLLTGLGGVYWSLTQAPAFYVEELQRPVEPEVQKTQAREFVQATMQLVDEIRNEDEWSERFTQEQINSWLAVELPKKFAKRIPPGTSDPRVRLSKNAVDVAFRCEHPRFQGVISGRFKPFVISPNVLAIKVESITLGLVPLPLDQILDQVGSGLQKAVTEAGAQMEWRQMEGADVLVIHLSNNDDHPILEAVQLEKGAIEVAGSRRKGGTSPTQSVISSRHTASVPTRDSVVSSRHTASVPTRDSVPYGAPLAAQPVNPR